jgi:hypothetical protein
MEITHFDYSGEQLRSMGFVSVCKLAVSTVARQVFTFNRPTFYARDLEDRIQRIYDGRVDRIEVHKVTTASQRKPGNLCTQI